MTPKKKASKVAASKRASNTKHKPGPVARHENLDNLPTHIAVLTQVRPPAASHGLVLRAQYTFSDSGLACVHAQLAATKKDDDPYIVSFTKTKQHAKLAMKKFAHCLKNDQTVMATKYRSAIPDPSKENFTDKIWCAAHL